MVVFSVLGSRLTTVQLAQVLCESEIRLVIDSTDLSALNVPGSCLTQFSPLQVSVSDSKLADLC